MKNSSLQTCLALCAVLLSGCGAGNPPEQTTQAPRRADAGPLATDGATVTAADSGAEPVASDSATEMADGSRADSAGDPDACPTFENAYDAIQEIIFERKGCTAAACHGESAVGGLDLRADVSYDNLVGQPSAGSSLARIEIGGPGISYLFHKVAAALEPDRYHIAGSPMPVGTSPLTADQVEALRIWIYEGAARTGAVADPSSGKSVADLLGACLPPAGPQPIEQLAPPAPGEGVQLVMPVYPVAGNSEHEVCIPFAYDLSDQIPAEYRDDAAGTFYVKTVWTRQDPVSHHMVVWQPFPTWDAHQDGGTWRCYGGDTPDAACDPDNGSRDCPGAGICGGDVFPTTFCADEYEGLTQAANGDTSQLDLLTLLTGDLAVYGLPDQLTGAGSPNDRVEAEDGVYRELPMRGVAWYNSHAFNLWDEDLPVNVRANYYFASDRQRKMSLHVELANSVPAGQPPFTVQDHCARYVVPQNHSIAIMFSHTHRHGKHFWVNGPDGERIYESFDYSDPVYQKYSPYLEFTSFDPATRTLEFCATFNNGLRPDGSYDTDLVTRASRMPAPGHCTPVACVEGRVGSSCTTDADCDSSTGAGDGFCDACAITDGSTTENEMFTLNVWQVAPALSPFEEWIRGLFP